MIRWFESHDEIRKLPGYVDKIRKDAYSTIEPLGWYGFRNEIRCAFVSCNQSHGRGYVVRLQCGDALLVVAIGHVCGASVLGEQFRIAARNIDEAKREHERRQALAERIALHATLLDYFKLLLSGSKGALWANAAEVSLQTVLPRYVANRLYARVGSNSSVIEAPPRERTKHDPPPLPGENPRLIVERLGEIRGLKALAIPSARQLIEDRLLKPLRAFGSVTVDALMSDKSLRMRFQHWHKGMPGYVQQAERRLQDAKVFYRTENLKQLAHLANHPTERARLMRLQWNEAEGRVEVSNGRDAA